MTSLSEQTHKADVLVVGGGLAGCWAALRARELGAQVTMVDKGLVARSGTTVFCHDILGPMPEGDREEWMREVVEHAQYISDQEHLEILLKEERKRIQELESWGVPFERDEKGQLFMGLGRGHKATRVVLCDCRKLMEVMRAKLIERQVKLIERVIVTDLLTSDGQHPTEGVVVGCVGIHARQGNSLVFKARAVVLATGLFGMKLRVNHGDSLTGDGPAMAFRAGAEFGDLEFSLAPGFQGFRGGKIVAPGIMPFQTQGAHMVNCKGERFMERYAPDKKERGSTFGTLAQAWSKETIEGRGPTYFDMRHFTPEHWEQIKRVLPIRMKYFEAAGVDPTKEVVECRPLPAHLCGGIRTNSWGQSTVAGLLAAGYCAQFSAAAERVSGTILAGCNVFGYRAGERAAQLAKEKESPPIDEAQVTKLKNGIFAPLKRKRGKRPDQIYHRLLRRLVRPEFSLVKSENTIKEMLAEIRDAIQNDLPQLYSPDIHELVKANEARNFLVLLEPFYLAALERQESRLTHYRIDYPFRDDVNWLRWIVLKRKDGKITVWQEAIPLERYPVKPRERLKTAHPIQISLTGGGKQPITLDKGR